MLGSNEENRMKSGVFIFVVAITASLASADAQAALLRSRDADRNHDGVVTRDEWRFSADQEFEFLDTNGDQTLSAAELNSGGQSSWSGYANSGAYGDSYGTRRWSSRTPNERFTRLDTDRDGAIIRSEWRWNPASFDKLDANHDGSINQDEFTNAQQNRAAVFSQVDQNGDGRITRNEWARNSGNDDTFTGLDLNHDNILTGDEFAAASTTQQASSAPSGDASDGSDFSQILLQLLGGKK
jgi:Ca2+-binding EF-hand superfamily protein